MKVTGNFHTWGGVRYKSRSMGGNVASGKGGTSVGERQKGDHRGGCPPPGTIGGAQGQPLGDSFLLMPCRNSTLLLCSIPLES